MPGCLFNILVNIKKIISFLRLSRQEMQNLFVPIVPLHVVHLLIMAVYIISICWILLNG